MDEKELIKKKTFSGIIWKFMERIIAQSISMIVSIIIARILSPDDYSVVSIVAIFFTFSNVLISGGLNTALIQKKDADIDDYSSVFCISIFLSILIYVILFFSAPTIASIYDKPILTPVIRIMSIILPINATKSIVCAYISSSLQFRKFFFSTIIGTVISAFVGIFLAYSGYGVWALVAQQMTNALLDTIILYVTTNLKLKLKVSIEKLKSLWKYGWKVLVSSLIGALYNELNPLFIGVKFSGSALSFYDKGRSFPMLIGATTTNTLSAVLFPFLSKFQDDKEELLKYTRKYISITSYVVFPLMLGLFAVGDKLICLLLTEKWIEATPYLRIFCICCMFDMINIGNCETIKAMGRSDIYLIMEIIKKVGYFIVIGLFILFSDSPKMLACSMLICALIAITVNSIPNIKLINYKFSYQIIDLVPNLVISCVMCAIVFAMGQLDMAYIILLPLQILTGIIIYILLSIITKNKNMRQLLNIAKSVMHR